MESKVFSDADKLRLAFPRLAAVHAGERGMKSTSVLYAIVDVRDGRRVGELELAKNRRPWDYLEAFPNGKKSRLVQYILAAILNEDASTLNNLKAQYPDAAPADDTQAAVPCVVLPDGSRVPYTLPKGYNYTPDDVANAVRAALEALLKHKDAPVSDRVNAFKGLQESVRRRGVEGQAGDGEPRKIDIRFDTDGLLDAVMQDSEHAVIMNEFVKHPDMATSPVVVLGPEYGDYAGPTQFIRSSSYDPQQTGCADPQ